MIYLENVEIHHLPSNVARVYGDERDVNIIANNYVIRKMCYPIFCIPILKLMLFLRMLKHEYYFKRRKVLYRRLIMKGYERKSIMHESDDIVPEDICGDFEVE